MTAVFEEIRDRRQVHALVIGVDYYRHCGPDAAEQKEMQHIASGIKQLSCAAPSAQAVARWLVDRQRDDEHAPLGSVELLLSSRTEAMTRFDTPGGPIQVEPATFDNIRAASDRWYERCDTREDNILWFYFCGHGLRLGQEDLLLTEDVGESPQRFFENAIDFKATRRAFLRCRAQIQCYFIDACRVTPEELLGARDIGARPLRTASSPRQPMRDTPIVYAAAPDEAAFGSYDRPTPFATAVLQALDGLAAFPGQRWEITTSGLGLAIERLMRWNFWPRKPGQSVTPAGEPKGGVLRVLSQPPVVPFRIGCRPLDALSGAQLRLLNSNHGYDITRPPTPERWHDAAPARSYELQAHFVSGEYPDATDEVFICPPHREFDLPVGS